MPLIQGAYHFWPKRVAFRNDYCLRCQSRAELLPFGPSMWGTFIGIPILMPDV
jgi:hypothetical protein